jgi:alpha-beta hydrolase superfamily lysophospholipase
MVVIDDARHAVHKDSPAGVAAVVGDFLDAIADPG